MAAYLTPDRVRHEIVNGKTITIKEKIIPATARAAKVCGHVPVGGAMKPNALLAGTGKPKGITIHNTGDISVAAATTPAEQYTRATWPNGNMSGVVVHFYVWRGEIWQNLSETERGWHAGDGSSRRAGHDGGQIGGNIDTIALELIGQDAQTEETGALLAAYLCGKYGLEPHKDVYTHNWWMHGKDAVVPGARKNCPAYILPRWGDFLAAVAGHARAVVKTIYRVQVGAYNDRANAEAMRDRLKNAGYEPIVVTAGGIHRVQIGAYIVRENARSMAEKLEKLGLSPFVTAAG